MLRVMRSGTVLLNAKNLPTHAVSAVFKTKLRPRFVGPFTVVAKKGLAYTLNLPKKMRTHPVFYVSLLKPYRDPEQEGSQGLAPEVAEPQRPAGVSVACRADPPAAPSRAQGAADAATRSRESHTTREAHGARGSHPRWRHSPPQLVRASSHDVPPHGACRSATPPFDPSHGDGQVPRPGSARAAPALLDEQGNRHFHVERILKRRRRQGHNQYLLKWRVYPHSGNSWEFEVPLRQDCPDVVDAFDHRDRERSSSPRPSSRSPPASRQ
jgi:hypothetical protein